MQLCGTLVPDQLGHLYGETTNDGASGQGSIFRYGLTSGYQLLHSFSPPNAGVCGSPIVASDALLYGALSTGLWRMQKSGADYNIFHLFSSEEFLTDRPSGGLTEASDGHIYGYARGGRLELGVLYEISPGPTPTESIPIFGGDGINFYLTGTIAADAFGHLYASNYLGDSQYRTSLTQFDVAAPAYDALGTVFGFYNNLTSQPLLAGDGNLYATSINTDPTSATLFGTIITYPLSNGPALTLTASKTSVRLGQTLTLTYSANNVFSNSMKQCFLTDNIPGHIIFLVHPAGSTVVKTLAAGTITYGFECGGVESATAVVTVH